MAVSSHAEPAVEKWSDAEQGGKGFADVGTRDVPPSEQHPGETLARKLSARQVQMIAIGGQYAS